MFARMTGRARAFLGRETTGLLVLSVVVGLFAAGGAVALRWAIALAQGVAFAASDPSATPAVLPWWLLLVAPAVGGLLVGPIVHLLAPEARGHGVPEIMRAVQHQGGAIRGRVALVKAAASAITIGSGGSCGREGPIAQIGASLASMVGQFVGVPPARLRVLTAAGAGAGIAATFNAPIAGAFFALEVVLGNFAMECFGPIVVASVVATVAAQPFLGPGALSTGIGVALVHPAELGVYAILGVLAALLAIVFGQALVRTEEAFERVPVPIWSRPMLGGLAVGAIACAGIPAVLGNGERLVSDLLHGLATLGVPFLVLLLGAKLVATCLTLGSGGSGGVFFPCLFMGAVLGELVAKVVGLVSPFETAPPAAYALVGMAAMTSAAAHAPITMGIMVFELTNDYKIIAPLLIAASIAATVSRGLQRDSIYTLRLSRRGVPLTRGVEAMIMHDLRVEDVMRRHECEVVPPSTPLSEVLRRFLEVRAEVIYVVDAEGRFGGVIPLVDVRAQIRETPTMLEDRLIIAADVARRDVPMLDASDRLTRALDALHPGDLHELPVVASQDGGGRFVGTLSEHDVLGAYNQEVLRKEALLARFVTRRTGEDDEVSMRTDYFELPAGYCIAQLPVPTAYVGRRLREVDLRRGLGLNVLAVKEKRADGFCKLMPDPERALQTGDLLVVMGPEAGVQKLRTSDVEAHRTS